jgi:hypothetical protein
MKTQLLHRWLILIAGVILLAPQADAQGGSGKLPPLPKPATTPTPKPKAATTPKSDAKNTASTSFYREPKNIAPLAFNQNADGRLDAKTAGRLTQTSFYDEYKLMATGGELFTIELQSGKRSLAVQLFDKEKAGLAILKDPRTGEFKLDTPGGLLPGEGEYHVRVLGLVAEANAAPIPYTLKLRLTGLTEDGYRARLQQITATLETPGEEKVKVENAIAQLQQLIQDEPSKPGAHEHLGVLYLEDHHDLAQAIAEMNQALKLGGTATFKISHDSQWRQPVKKQGQGLAWEDERTSWLKIRADQIEVTDASETQLTYFSISGRQIKEVLRPGNTFVLHLKPEAGRNKPRFFAPSGKDPAVTEVILGMIKSHVLRKS